jgi:hypothetical protein
MLKFSYNKLKKSRFRYLEKDLLTLCNNDVWLAGGAIRSIKDNKPPNDYDFFFRNAIVAGETKEKIIDLGYNVVFVCPVGSLITLMKDKVKVQLILSRFYLSCEDCINTFDFTVTCAGFDGEFIYLHDKYLRDLKKLYLRINILQFPSSTVNRLIKYKKYGYSTADCIVDIMTLTYNQDPNIQDISFLYMD